MKAAISAADVAGVDGQARRCDRAGDCVADFGNPRVAIGLWSTHDSQLPVPMLRKKVNGEACGRRIIRNDTHRAWDLRGVADHNERVRPVIGERANRGIHRADRDQPGGKTAVHRERQSVSARVVPRLVVECEGNACVPWRGGNEQRLRNPRHKGVCKSTGNSRGNQHAGFAMFGIDPQERAKVIRNVTQIAAHLEHALPRGDTDANPVIAIIQQRRNRRLRDASGARDRREGDILPISSGGHPFPDGFPGHSRRQRIAREMWPIRIRSGVRKILIHRDNE